MLLEGGEKRLAYVWGHRHAIWTRLSVLLKLQANLSMRNAEMVTRMAVEERVIALQSYRLCAAGFPG